MKCINCGFEFTENTLYCPRCGITLPATKGDQSPVSPLPPTLPENIYSASTIVTPASPHPETHNRESSASPAGSKNKSKFIIIGAAVGAAALCLLVLIVAAAGITLSGGQLSLPFLSSGANYILVGVPAHKTTTDLYLLKVGQAIKNTKPVAEDIAPSKGGIYTHDKGFFQILGVIDTVYGAFLPGTNDLVLQFSDNDKTTINLMTVGSGKSKQLMDSKYRVYSVSLGKGKFWILEDRDSGTRCYISQAGKEAERVGKGNRCMISGNAGTFLIADSTNNKTTLTVIDSSGKNEVVLLEDETGVINYISSYDGSLIAVEIMDDNREYHIRLYDRRSGEELVKSEKFTDYITFGFSMTGNQLFLIGKDKEGERSLYLMDRNNTAYINAGKDIVAALSQDGSYLVYRLTEDPFDQTLYVYPTKGGSEIELLNGVGTGFTILSSPERILIYQFLDDELTISSSDISGKNLVELYQESGVKLQFTWYVLGEDQLYLVVTDGNAKRSLFVTSMTRNDGVYLIEEWYEINLLNRSPNQKTLVFTAREDSGDDLGLFTINLAAESKPVLQDEAGRDENFSKAIFTQDNKMILYTKVTGTNYNDLQVCQANVGKKDTAKVLYDEAFLIDAQWARINLFLSIYFMGVNQ